MSDKPDAAKKPLDAGSGRFRTVQGSETMRDALPVELLSTPAFDFDTLGTILDRFGVAKKAAISEAISAKSNDSEAALKELIAQKHLTDFQAKIVREKGASELLFGEYLLIDTLGAGGMGEVFKAKNLSLGRMEAIKTIRADEGIGELLAKRFKQEARLLALLEHANFVPIYRYGRAGDVDFIAMRFVEGETLKSRIDSALKNKTLPPWREVCRWISEAAKAIDYAHQSGIIHRDLKPSNLMIGPRGNIVVLDMGIARLMDDGKSTAGEGLTASSRALGTPEYMPPEQWADAREVSQASDVYSLGVSLFHVLTLQTPFQGNSLTDLMLAHTTKVPPKASSIRKDLPKALDAILAKSLEKSPNARFASMEAFADALDQLGPVVTATPSGLAKWIWPAAATVSVAAAAIAVFLNRPTHTDSATAAVVSSMPGTTTPTDSRNRSNPPAEKTKPADPPVVDIEPKPQPVDWLAGYATAHATEWPSFSDLRAFALGLVSNDSSRLSTRSKELLQLLDGETRRRKLDRLEPFKYLTADANKDQWSEAALAAVQSIISVHAVPEDRTFRIDTSFVDVEGKPLDRIEVGQRFQVAVRPSKDAYITFVQMDGGFLFVFPFPRLIPANQTLALTNVLAFGSPGQKTFIVYATDRVLVDKLVKPDPDDTPRLPRLFATKDAFERVETCLRHGKPAAGVETAKRISYWSRTTVHLEVVRK